MVEIKNIHGQVIAQVENPEVVVRDIYGNITATYPADRTNDLDLSELDLREADFRGWDLRGAWFYLSDLRGADFREANLHMADFFCAEFEGADFSYADLSSSNILDNIEICWDEINFEGADLPMRHHHNHCC